MENIFITHARRKAYFSMEESHSHEDYEIYYLLSGTCRFFIHDTLYTLKKGDFALLRSGVLHKTAGTGDGDFEKIDIYFKPSYLKNIFGDSYSEIEKLFDSPHITPHSVTTDTAEGIMNRLCAEYELKEDFSDMVLECYMRELLIFLHRCKNSGQYLPVIGGNSITDKAARFIVENYMNNITLEDVSRFVHLSPGYFSKKFKKDTGIGFREYLSKIRLHYAAEMLESTNLSITEIAFMCGFNNSNYFGDAFTAIMGVSPMKYRQVKKKYG